MSNEQRQKYAELKRQSDSLNSNLEKLQEEMASIVTKRKQLEEEVSLSQVKLEAVALYTKLREAQEKRDALLEEEATKGTPAQERERLLKQVKQDNAQLAGKRLPHPLGARIEQHHGEMGCRVLRVLRFFSIRICHEQESKPRSPN